MSPSVRAWYCNSDFNKSLKMKRNPQWPIPLYTLVVAETTFCHSPAPTPVSSPPLLLCFEELLFQMGDFIAERRILLQTQRRYTQNALQRGWLFENSSLTKTSARAALRSRRYLSRYFSFWVFRGTLFILVLCSEELTGEEKTCTEEPEPELEACCAAPRKDWAAKACRACWRSSSV